MGLTQERGRSTIRQFPAKEVIPMGRRFTILVSMYLAFFLTACGGGGNGDSSEGAPGTVRVLVTDAPFPVQFVESATVVIREVSVRAADGSGYINVFSGSDAVDLVPLTGGVSAQLLAAAVPPGSYDEARLLVDAGEVVLKETAFVSGESRVFNSASGTLRFPSGAQTGIKVKIDPPIQVFSRLSADLILDFDLDKNFVFNGPVSHAPGVKGVVFTPVIRAVNASTAGTLAVRAFGDNGTPGDTGDDPPLEGANVTVLDQDGAEAGGSATDGAGLVEIPLPPGFYAVAIEIDGHNTETLADVEVVAANVTEEEVLLTATSGQISGTVVDASDDSNVLEGVEVTLFLAGKTDALDAQPTNHQGAFRFDGLAPGQYDLSFRFEGFTEQTVAEAAAVTSGTSVGQVVLQPTH
jgi:hypothetical protein